MENRISLTRTTWILLLLLLLITIALFIGAHFYFAKQKSEIKEEQSRFLSSISDFTINEIQHWMSERKAESVFLSESPAFIDLVAALDKRPGNEYIRTRIIEWISPIKRNHEYTGIWVFNTRGQMLVQHRDSAVEWTDDEMRSHLQTVSDGKVILSDLLIDPRSGDRYMTSLAILKQSDRLVGFILFKINPDIYFLPLIASWPIKRASAENLLARQWGDSVMYLNEMPREGGFSTVFSKATQVDQLAKNIPEGGTLAGLEAKDYRGVEVLANAQRIPDTKWSLISKIDLNEIYAPLKKRTVNIILYMLTFLVVFLVTGILIWKNQQLQYYRSHYQLQSKSAKAEEKIRFMNALLQEVNDAIITFDKDLMIQSWNKGAERIYGWVADEVIGKYGGGSLRVDFPGSSRETIFKELEKKGYWKGEVVHKRKDGSTAYLLSSTSQLRDEDGNVLGIITINKDISAVVHSEKIKNAVYRISELALTSKDIDEMYSAIHVVISELMDARNLYIAILEPDGETIAFPYFVDERDSAPPPKRKGTGLTEYVLKTGKPLLAKPEDIQYFSDRGIIEIIGSPSVDWLGVPLRIEKDTIGVLVVQSYSTKVRYGEREKDILIFVSEQIALSIHRKKITQELIEAKEKAEVSNNLTSSLLANMNHELRTPMNGILGFAEILMNELTNPDEQVKAENILTSGRRLMDTLDAIMDLSYLESDKISRKFKPVDVGKVVNTVLHIYEPSIKRKQLSLVKKIPVATQVLGDDHLFQHLMKNLIDNAVKYTEKGSITISADLIEKDGHSHVSIVVKDTGIGISDEHHKMIFDAFRQVSEGYGRQFEGSGLGLTLSHRIVKLMGGGISLVSTIGMGSEFRIVLPAVVKFKAAVEPDKTTAITPKLHASGDKKMPDILLVEDNTVNLQLLMVYLQDIGNIYSALDGRSAIELAQQRQFDVVLMDINLGPGMDGIQAMLEICKRPDYRKVPFIAVTGYASIGDRDRLLSIGFAAYLPKPFSKDKIAALMEELLPG